MPHSLPSMTPLNACTELIEVVQRLDGEMLSQALGSLARLLLESPEGGYYIQPPRFAHEIVQIIAYGDTCCGYYALSGRAAGYDAAARQILTDLADVTGRLLVWQTETARMAIELNQTTAQNEHQSQILEQINDSVIAMDLAGYITHWNKGAERMFGYTADEALGRNVLFLYDRDDAPAPDGLANDIFMEHGGREMEIRHRRKSGEIFWASLSLSLVRDRTGEPSGLIGYLTDITERISAHEKLSLSSRVFEVSEEAIFITDADERIISVNQAFQRITGYAADDVLGRHARMFDSDYHEPHFFARRRDSIRVSGCWQGEVWERRKDGELYPKWASFNTMKNAQGEVTHYFSIFIDISERKHSEERINHLAYYDALTDLPNRTLLYKLLEQAFVTAQRNQQQAALLFIDLNRFKPINDSLGHDIGDRLLQQVAQRLCHQLRDNDVVARMGGDEFACGLFNVARREHAANVAQKLLDALEAPFLIDQHELRIGASIGISIFPDDSLDAVTLLRYADVAMCRAKQAAQDGYAFFNAEMNQTVMDRLSIEGGLRRALKHCELRLHYQPKVDVASGLIVGAEALVRWLDPARGLVPPGEFIPIAEESGLITDIGAWVLEEVCRQAQEWQRVGLSPVKLAVNISARQLSSKLPQLIATLLERYSLAPAWLELELTESMLMDNTDGVIAMMDQLNAMGIELSLDDFGTGYSSLSYLKRFPINTLKIDRSFIINTPGNIDDCAIAGAITSMAKQLRLKVIAEGVENQQQLDFLRSLDCEEVQGFFYSRPLPAAEFFELMQSSHGMATVALP